MKSLLRSKVKFTLVAAASLAALFILLAYVPHWFTSGIVASASAPAGEEFHVIQTYKGIGEPYQVTLYARKPGQKWTSTYLAHQDDSWSGCQININEDTLTVSGGDEKERKFSVEALTNPEGRLTGGSFSADYTPERLAADHETTYRRGVNSPFGVW